MRQPFIITGLPRSRTAWMSVLCTTDTTFCHHEPSARMSRMEDLQGILSSGAYEHIGAADHFFGFFMPWIMENINPRVLVIERDLDEVNDSTEKLGIPPSTYNEVLLDKLQPFKCHKNVMWMPYDAMTEKRVVEKCFMHLLPGKMFDESRYELLEKMVVTVDMEYAVEQALKRAKHIHKMLEPFNHLIRLKEHAATIN